MNVIELLDSLPGRDGETVSYGYDIDSANDLLFF